MKLKLPTEKIKDKVNQVKEEVISQDFEAQVPEEEEKVSRWQGFKTKTKKIKKKYLLIGLGALLFLIIILILASSTIRISQHKPPAIPSPSPSPFEEEIDNPSAYATDEAVLEIGGKLKEIEKEIEQADLKETGLNPPILDMEVNFEE